MNYLLIKKSKTEPRNLVQLRFILKSGLYQIYKEKCTFLAAPVIEMVNPTPFMRRK